jgi:hypothetical protein
LQLNCVRFEITQIVVSGLQGAFRLEVLTLDRQANMGL